MAYMLLMIEPPEQRATRTREQGQQVYARMERFADELKTQGLLLGVESLASQKQASRVQVRDGRSRVVDGPFAEAKEMVGGFFLVNCTTHDEALAIAKRCPAAEWCTVEVRSLAPCFDDSNAPTPGAA
ncbi:MAG TPA: YciI family protein [Burkholderiaceae bacterium]